MARLTSLILYAPYPTRCPGYFNFTFEREYSQVREIKKGVQNMGAFFNLWCERKLEVQVKC